MFERRHRGFLIAVSVLVLAPLGLAHASADRVVSINLCADQFLALLIHPGQLVSVTHLAGVPEQSFVHDRIDGLYINKGRAEEILALDPDLVVAGLHAARPAVSMLQKLGVEVMDLPIPNSFADIRAQTMLLAQRLGVEGKGRALLNEMDARLAAVRHRPPSRRRALVLGANGFTNGTGTLIDEVLKGAGLRNVAVEDLKIRGFGQVGLEDILSADPDLIVVNQSTNEAPSLAGAFLQHPALARFADRTVTVDPSLWTCGGPFTARMVEYLNGAAQ